MNEVIEEIRRSLEHGLALLEEMARINAEASMIVARMRNNNPPHRSHSSVVDFVNGYMVLSGNKKDRVTGEELYSVYQTNCEKDGITPRSYRMFCADLKSLIGDKKQYYVGDKRVYGYIGVQLKHDDHAQEV